MPENQVGVQAIFDTSKFESGEKKYVALLADADVQTERMAEVINGFRSRLDAISVSIDNMSTHLKSMGDTEDVVATKTERVAKSATSARQAIYGTADAIEMFGGPNLAPAVRNIEGLAGLLSTIGATAAVGAGAIAVGTVIGAGIVEGMKRGGIVSPEAQGAAVTAKQLGAMAYSQAQFALNYVTSLGDMEKATIASNKAFVDASVSLGLMTKQQRWQIAAAQDWLSVSEKISYRDLTGDAEQYAKARAKEREQEDKRNSIIEKYSKKQVSITTDSLDADIRAERDYYASREDAMRKYGLNIERLEEAHQRAMFQKQAQYAMSMSDAIGARDAIAASRIQRQYDLDRTTAETEQAARVRQQSEYAANELEAMSDKFAIEQAVRDENAQKEINALAESKREELAVFQASLDAEKAAREQYSRDVAEFWKQQAKNFPNIQQFPNYNFPIVTTNAPGEPALHAHGSPTLQPQSMQQQQTVFSQTASMAGYGGGAIGSFLRDVFDTMFLNPGMAAATSGAKQLSGSLDTKIRDMFNDSVLNVLTDLFGEIGR